MNIQDALKETGKVCLSGSILYAELNKVGVLHWHGKDTSQQISPVLFMDIVGSSWQPYPNKKEIRPERAGEVWIHEINDVFLIIRSDGGLKVRSAFDILWESDGKLFNSMIHNLNGWQLLYSPDEEVMKDLKSNL